jgi:tetratricopeptide (TPR) repeat protein
LRLLRFAAAALIAAAAALAVAHFAWQPLACSIQRRQLTVATQKLGNRHDIFVITPARENAAVARRCALAVRCDPGLYVLAAENYRICSDWPDAEAMLAEALKYDRRPEIYWALGVMQLEMGQVAESKHALVQAALFDPYIILDIGPDDVRNEVMNEVGQRRMLPWWGPDQPALKALKRKR